VTKPSPKQTQLERSPDAQMTSAGMPRRVSVKACQGENAIVVVTVLQGQVWMSIVPPFTWEAIMEPGKVDELIRTLTLARDEAAKMAVARGARVARGDEATGRVITGGTAR
jgi:hypothetical protein